MEEGALTQAGSCNGIPVESVKHFVERLPELLLHNGQGHVGLKRGTWSWSHRGRSAGDRNTQVWSESRM